jgi:hypothetical protein
MRVNRRTLLLITFISASLIPSQICMTLLIATVVQCLAVSLACSALFPVVRAVFAYQHRSRVLEAFPPRLLVAPAKS